MSQASTQTPPSTGTPHSRPRCSCSLTRKRNSALRAAARALSRPRRSWEACDAAVKEREQEQATPSASIFRVWAVRGSIWALCAALDRRSRHGSLSRCRPELLRWPSTTRPCGLSLPQSRSWALASSRFSRCTKIAQRLRKSCSSGSATPRPAWGRAGSWGDDVQRTGLDPHRGGVPIAPVRELDPRDLGVDPEVIEGWAYVDRAVDRELRTSLRAASQCQGASLIVVRGPSKAGKSRTLYQAAREVAPDAWVVAPRDAEALRVLLRPGVLPASSCRGRDSLAR